MVRAQDVSHFCLACGIVDSLWAYDGWVCDPTLMRSKIGGPSDTEWVYLRDAPGSFQLVVCSFLCEKGTCILAYYQDMSKILRMDIPTSSALADAAQARSAPRAKEVLRW